MSLIFVMNREWVLSGVRAKANGTGDGIEITKSVFYVRYLLDLKITTDIDNRAKSIIKAEN
jgi:hypothetical protein